MDGSTPTDGRAWRIWVAAAALACAMLALASLLAPVVSVSPIVAYGLGFAAIAASVIACARTVPQVRRPHLALAVVPLATLLLVRITGASGLAAALPVTAALLLGGSLIGALVAREVEHAGYLVFVAVVSSAVDFVSVMHPGGVSAAIAQSPTALSIAALPWPMLGTSAIEPFLGVGDVVFAALYTRACGAHGLDPKRTLWALTLAFGATLALVLTLQIPLPALPLLGGAIIVAHPEARRPPAADRRRGTIGAVLIVAACAAAFIART